MGFEWMGSEKPGFCIGNQLMDPSGGVNKMPWPYHVIAIARFGSWLPCSLGQKNSSFFNEIYPIVHLACASDLGKGGPRERFNKMTRFSNEPIPYQKNRFFLFVYGCHNLLQGTHLPVKFLKSFRNLTESISLFY